MFPTPVGMNRGFAGVWIQRIMFPTPVGMNRHCDKIYLKTPYVPHTRGDEPAMFLIAAK